MYKLFLLLSVISITCIACDKNKIFEENVAIENNIWNIKKPIQLTIPVEDTQTPNNIYLNIRNATSYPFQNLYVFLEMTTPDGKKTQDTVGCTLQQNGEWTGECAGDICDNQVLFKTNYLFTQKGNYTFTLNQASYNEELPGIMDVGLRIEKIKNDASK